MAPEPVERVRQYVDGVQTSLTDPAERLRALAVVKRELEDTLGVVVTYMNDAQLEQEGSAGSSDGSTGPEQSTTEGPGAT